MDAIASLREGLGSQHWLIEACLEGLTSEQLHWLPSGTAHSIAATYAHVVLGEDAIVHGWFLGKPPLAASAKTGVSAPPPQGSEGPEDWSAWARSVKVDIAAFQEYAKTVYGAADQYLASLKPEDLDRQMDMPAGLGKQSLNWVIHNIVLGHLASHCGEIAAVKGLQGLRGYPF